MPPGYRQLYAVIAEFLDNLSPDFDFEDSLRVFAAECVNLLGCAGVVFLVVDEKRAVEITVAWGDGADELAAVEAAAGRGPGLECLAGGRTVECRNGTAARERWPEWSAAALRSGFLAAHAVPLASRGEVLGAMILLLVEPDRLDADSEQILSSFAEAAAANTRYRREDTRRAELIDQLQTGMTSRVVIEQAKGILAERNGQSVDEALASLRDFARRNRRPLHDVAREVVDGTVGPPLGRVSEARDPTGDAP
jgi:transcriptional regulator with GAF, ATPase, and Fis domain